MKAKDKVEINNNDFSNIIYLIRSENNLTQKQFADLINVSDRTVSKWENGQTIPDLVNIQNICEKLDVSPKYLIKRKKSLKDINHQIKMKLGKLLNICFNKIFMICFIVIFALLLIYFVNNYNSEVLYEIKYTNDNISIKDGHFVNNKYFAILVIDNIELKNVDYKFEDIRVELYTNVNGDKHVIYEADNLDDIYIKQRKQLADILTKDVINAMNSALYLKIDVTDKKGNNYTYESDLTLKQVFKNNKLMYRKFMKEKSSAELIGDIDDEVKNFASPHVVKDNYDDMNNSTASKTVNKLSSLSFDYDEIHDIYTKVDNDGAIIEYSKANNYINIKSTNKDDLYLIKYTIDRERIYYIKLDEQNTEIIYFVNDNRYEGNMKNTKEYSNKINYILDLYSEISKLSN